MRLEFNQSRLEYYAELDAVRLSGTRDDGTPTGDTQDGRTEGRRASAASHDATPTSDVADGLAQLRLEHEPTETETMRSEGCYFSSLPVGGSRVSGRMEKFLSLTCFLEGFSRRLFSLQLLFRLE